MRTVAKISSAIFLALTVSSSASAIVSVTPTQIGSTYSASGFGGTLASDSLILRVDYAITGGTLVSSIDVATSAAILATLGPGSSGTGPASLEFSAVSAVPVGEPRADIATQEPDLTGAGGFVFTDAQGHTVVVDAQGNDITADSRLGSFMLFPVPEASTASLFGLGLVGLAAMKRRRS